MNDSEKVYMLFMYWGCEKIHVMIHTFMLNVTRVRIFINMLYDRMTFGCVVISRSNKIFVFLNSDKQHSLYSYFYKLERNLENTGSF